MVTTRLTLPHRIATSARDLFTDGLVGAQGSSWDRDVQRLQPTAKGLPRQINLDTAVDGAGASLKRKRRVKDRRFESIRSHPGPSNEIDATEVLEQVLPAELPAFDTTAQYTPLEQDDYVGAFIRSDTSTEQHGAGFDCHAEAWHSQEGRIGESVPAASSEFELEPAEVPVMNIAAARINMIAAHLQQHRLLQQDKSSQRSSSWHLNAAGAEHVHASQSVFHHRLQQELHQASQATQNTYQHKIHQHRQQIPSRHSSIQPSDNHIRLAQQTPSGTDTGKQATDPPAPDLSGFYCPYPACHHTLSAGSFFVTAWPDRTSISTLRLGKAPGSGDAAGVSAREMMCIHDGCLETFTDADEWARHVLRTGGHHNLLEIADDEGPHADVREVGDVNDEVGARDEGKRWIFDFEGARAKAATKGTEIVAEAE